MKRTKRWNFVRNFLTTLSVLTTSAFVALGTTACFADSGNTVPENSNPPIKIQDPGISQNPESPDIPENPGSSTPENFGSENPTPEKPDHGKEDPTPEHPLTREEKITKIIQSVQQNVQNFVSTNSTINKYIAIDFKEETNNNYCDVLVDYTKKIGSKYYDAISLVRVPMQTNASEYNIKNGAYIPTNTTVGNNLITVSKDSYDTRITEALAKLKSDNVIDKIDNYDFATLLLNGGGASNELACGVTGIDVCVLNNKQIIKYHLAIKSDGSTHDFLGDYLLNGTLGKTYLLKESGSYGDNALYAYEGLEQFNTNQTKSYNFMVNNSITGICDNGKYQTLEEKNM